MNITKNKFAFIIAAFATFIYTIKATFASAIGDALYKGFGFIFVDLTGNFGTKELFYAKFILFLLLFSFLYFAVGLIPWGGTATRRNMPNNIKIVISFSVAMLSILAIPKEIIQNMFQTYGVVYTFLLYSVPVGVLLFLMYGMDTTRQARENNRIRYLFHAASFYVISALLHGMSIAVSKTYHVGTNQDYVVWIDFAAAVALITMIVYLFMAIFGGAGGQEGAPVNDAGAQQREDQDRQRQQQERQNRQNLQRLGQVINQFGAEVQTYSNAVDNIQNMINGGQWGQVPGQVNNIEQIARRCNDFMNTISNDPQFQNLNQQQMNAFAALVRTHNDNVNIYNRVIEALP